MNFWKNKIIELSKAPWGGMTHRDTKEHLTELYELLDWFTNKTKDDYLARSSSSVKKALKKDKVPAVYIKALLEEEKSNKNRKAIIKELKDDLNK